MSFSVGILYSAQEFVGYIKSSEISVEDFKNSFRRFPLAKPEDILAVCNRCCWIEITKEGTCLVTKKGLSIIEASAELNLRRQIEHLLEVDAPVWATKIPHGRTEALKFFPDEVVQCFKDAGLLGLWVDDLVTWWDRFSMASRNTKNAMNLLVGRKAERLTIRYEKRRVGVEPRWQCLDSNFSGFDVLSITEKASGLNRMIEVKGSTLPRTQAFCFVTRNEWQTALHSYNYCFHLWCLRDDNHPLLFEVSTDEMKKHVPNDAGMGAWENVKIPFKTFGGPIEFKDD